MVPRELPPFIANQELANGRGEVAVVNRQPRARSAREHVVALRLATRMQNN